jgi:hypothetical protein
MKSLVIIATWWPMTNEAQWNCLGLHSLLWLFISVTFNDWLCVSACISLCDSMFSNVCLLFSVICVISGVCSVRLGLVSILSGSFSILLFKSRMWLWWALTHSADSVVCSDTWSVIWYQYLQWYLHFTVTGVLPCDDAVTMWSLYWLKHGGSAETSWLISGCWALWLQPRQAGCISCSASLQLSRGIWRLSNGQLMASKSVVGSVCRKQCNHVLAHASARLWLLFYSCLTVLLTSQCDIQWRDISSTMSLSVYKFYISFRLINVSLLLIPVGEAFLDTEVLSQCLSRETNETEKKNSVLSRGWLSLSHEEFKCVGCREANGTSLALCDMQQ